MPMLFAPMFCSVSIRMIEFQELLNSFATTGAHVAVCCKGLCSQFSFVPRVIRILAFSIAALDARLIIRINAVSTVSSTPATSNARRVFVEV